MNSWAFNQKIKLLTRRYPSSQKLGTTHILSLLNDLGNPQNHLPPTIHIAGTNGKGSTQAFLKSILMAEQYRVHAYISPHLVRFTERITLANHEITEDRFIHYLNQALSTLSNQPITWFELCTAVALLAFHSTPGEAVILETGMGGRLDATNVIKAPACTVITSLSYDHQHHLGDRLALIATEKAGIFKTNVPVVTCHQPPEARDVLRDHAQHNNCRLYEQGREWQCVQRDQTLYFTFLNQSQAYVLPNLIGSHQIQNAGLALATLFVLKDILSVTLAAINQGLGQAHWPGRLQNLKNHPYQKLLPENISLYLDGAHDERGF